MAGLRPGPPESSHGIHPTPRRAGSKRSPKPQTGLATLAPPPPDQGGSEDRCSSEPDQLPVLASLLRPKKAWADPKLTLSAPFCATDSRAMHNRPPCDIHCSPYVNIISPNAPTITEIMTSKVTESRSNPVPPFQPGTHPPTKAGKEECMYDFNRTQWLQQKSNPI